MSMNLKDTSRCVSLCLSPDDIVNNQLVQYQKKINSNKYNETGENVKRNFLSKCTFEKYFFRFLCFIYNRSQHLC